MPFRVKELKSPRAKEYDSSDMTIMITRRMAEDLIPVLQEFVDNGKPKKKDPSWATIVVKLILTAFFGIGIGYILILRALKYFS